MSVFSQNLKFLRGELSQEAAGKAIGLSRFDINNYESDNSNPSVDKLLKISGYFKFNINTLLTIRLDKLSKPKLEALRSNYLTKDGGLQVLTTTVDINNKDNIDLVDVKARAGYMAGYADQQFIERLPKFHLPHFILPKDKTYRAFQIDGDSMLPVRSGSWITCYYVENLKEIKDGHGYVLITHDEGVVFKLVYSRVKEKETLLLVSLNPAYAPYEINIREVKEIWKFALKFSDQIVDDIAA
jgi:phage repressor protein C with HTH and peptisase S24 domain